MASLQRRTVKGIDYWSLVESKRVNGKPRPIVIENFGNTKKFTEWIVNGRNENKVLKSYSHGDTYALMKLAERLEVEKMLDDIFPIRTRKGIKRSTSILLLAIQSVCSPGSKSEFESWIKTTTLPYDCGVKMDLTCRRLWEQMDDITTEELVKAEDSIVQKIFRIYSFEFEKIALDYTNYYSYISTSNDKNTLAKRGHNKQKRNDLRQYSLALITTKESGLPLCSHVYEGNKNDKTIFPEYLTVLKERIPNYDPETITLVFDGGSNTKDNFKTLETHFICSFSLHYCKDLYDIQLSEYENISVNGKKVLCYRITHDIWGEERECVLTFSTSLYAGQWRELDENISKAINSIETLNEQLRNPKSRISKTKETIQAKVKAIIDKRHMETVFNILIEETPENFVSCVKYDVDEDVKHDVAYKYFGKKLLISDQKEWSTESILKTYREQDCIEKIFRSTKNNDHCAIRPQFHYTNQKIRVHIFCCLLGLTLATILHIEVTSKGLTIPKFQLLDVLSSIRRCWVKDKDSTKVINVMEEMDDTQKEIWDIIQAI
jgi:transposase